MEQSVQTMPTFPESEGSDSDVGLHNNMSSDVESFQVDDDVSNLNQDSDDNEKEEPRSSSNIVENVSSSSDCSDQEPFLLDDDVTNSNKNGNSKQQIVTDVSDVESSRADDDVANSNSNHNDEEKHRSSTNIVADVSSTRRLSNEESVHGHNDDSVDSNPTDDDAYLNKNKNNDNNDEDNQLTLSTIVAQVTPYLSEPTKSTNFTEKEKEKLESFPEVVETKRKSVKEIERDHLLLEENGKGCVGRLTELIQLFLVSFVVKTSLMAARKPKICICLISAISILMIWMGFTTNFNINLDQSKLFSPTNTRTEKHQEWLLSFRPDSLQHRPQFQNDDNNRRHGRRMEQRQVFDADMLPFRIDAPIFAALHPLVTSSSSSSSSSSSYSSSPPSSLFSSSSNETEAQPSQPPLLPPPPPQQTNRRLEGDVSTNIISLLVHTANGNILDESIAIEGIRRTFDAIDSMRLSSGYDAICSSASYINPQGVRTCEIRGVTRFWYHNRTLFEQQVESRQDIIETLSQRRYPDGAHVDINFLVGRAQTDPDTGLLFNGESYLTFILMPFHAAPLIVLNEHEDHLLEDVLDLRQQWKKEPGNKFRLETFSRQSYEQELFRGLIKDLPLIPTVFLIMVVFTCFIFAKCDPVRSRTALALGSVVTITFSLATGYGLLMCFGVPFTPMTSLLPFLAYGIGLDDTFIIMGAYNRTDSKKDTLVRIEETMSDIALSICATTITTTLAFVFGLISSIPSIYWLCLYAFPTIFIDFLYQITLFVAILALDESRVQAQRYDCCCCLPLTSRSWLPSFSTSSSSFLHSISPSAIRCWCCCLCCAFSYTFTNPLTKHDDKDDDDYGKEQQQEQSPPQEQQEDVDEQEQQKQKHEQLEQQQPQLNCSSRFMVWYTDQLMKPWVKRSVLVIFTLYLGASTYFTSQMRQEFKITDLVPKDSYVRDFVLSIQTFTNRAFGPQIVFRYVDQADRDIQDQMIDYVYDLTEIPGFGEVPPFCWIIDFETFLDSNSPFAEMTKGLSFNEQVDFLLQDPTLYNIYGWQFTRDLGTKDVLFSKCLLYINDVDLNDVRSQMDFFNQINTVTALQPLNRKGANPYTVDDDDWSFFIYDDLFFIWEFYTAAVNELISSTLSAIASVCIVAFVVIPHWSSILFIMPTISVLYIDLVGTLQYIGIRINAVTYIALVVSIGLMVDFVVHVLIRYYESTCTTRVEKVKDSLQTMGKSILVGGLTTFVSTTPLLWSTSELLSTIFVSFFVMVTLSLLHGLVLLPVVLSYVGPTDSQLSVLMARRRLAEGRGGVGEEEESSNHHPAAFLASSS